MLYESISNSLNKKINRMINEANREFTPEEQKDLDLIRSAIRKRRDKGYDAQLTKAEQDALERRGFEVNGSYFSTPGGHISTVGYGEPKLYYRGREREPKYVKKDGEYYNIPKSRVIGGNTDGLSSIYDNGEPNINLIDMSKKQTERDKNQIRDKYSPWGDEGGKSSVILPVRNKKKGSGYRNNRLDAERYEQNYNLQNNIRTLQQKLGSRGLLKKDREKVFYKTDEDRNAYLKEIEKYRKLLAELDAKEEDQITSINNRIDTKTNEIRDFLNSVKNKNR